MELYQMVEKAWVRTFENYLFTASRVGRDMDIREALKGIIDHVNKSAGQTLFHVRGPENDDRYFVVELEGVRIATFFKNNTLFEASVMPNITPSIFNTVDTFIHDAIKYMTLVYSHEAIKRSVDPFVKQIEANRANTISAVMSLAKAAKVNL